MTDKDNFEKRLLSELRQVSAENPAPATSTDPVRSRPYGRFAAAGMGLAAVVAGVAIYTSTGDNTTSAYAVEKQSDGKVSVEITDLTKASGLEESLAAAGVPAEVMPTAATVCAVELGPDDVPKGDLRKAEPTRDPASGPAPGPATAVAPTTEPDGDVVKAVPAIPAESGRTGIPAGAPGVPAMSETPVAIELKKTDVDGASFSIDPDTIEEGQKVIIAPTKTKPADKLIPASAPSAAPIAVSIGAPGEPPC